MDKKMMNQTKQEKIETNDNVRTLYNEILQRLSLIDFDRIWKGFHKYKFALYNDETVYLEETTIPRDNRFIANTSIEYDGEYIAIWNVQYTKNEDLDVLASHMVHEMFHVFQNVEQEKRFPNDFILLDYPDTIKNLTLKRYENKILCDAFLADNQADKLKYLTEYMAVRKYRQSQIGNIILQEYSTETIEGMAEYAGSMALRQLSPQKYKKRMEEYMQYLTTMNKDFFDHRRMLYYSGTLFCMSLVDAGIEIYHRIGACKQTLFEIVSKDIEAVPVVITEADTAFENFVEQYRKEKEHIFENFLQQHTNKTIGNFTICGYDPMNMIKLHNIILCTHFVMLREAQAEEPKFMEGPLAVVLQEGTEDKVCAYIL